MEDIEGAGAIPGDPQPSHFCAKLDVAAGGVLIDAAAAAWQSDMHAGVGCSVYKQT